MNSIFDWPKTKEPKSCLKCVHHTYETGADEVQVLVCFLRRKLIEKPEEAVSCISYYTPNMDAD